MTEERRRAIEREREKIITFVDDIICNAVYWGKIEKTVNMGYKSFSEELERTENETLRARTRLLNYIDLVLEN